MTDLAARYIHQGEVEQALRLSDRAMRLARKTGYIDGMGYALIRKSEVYLRTSDFDNALRQSQKAASILQQSTNPAKRVLADLTSANIYNIAGRYAEAIQLAQPTLPLFESAADRKNLAAALGIIAYAFGYLGDISSSLELYLQALAIKEESGEAKSIAVGYYHIGRLNCDMRQYDDALKYLSIARSMFQQIGHALGNSQAINTIGNVYMHLGDFDRALAAFHESLEFKQQIGDQVGAGTTLMNMGILYKDQQQYAAALECCSASRRAFDSVDYQGPHRWNLLRIIGIIQSRMKRYRSAIGYYGKALKGAEAMGYKDTMAASHGDCGDAHEAIGNHARALYHLRKEHEIEEEIFNEKSANRIKALTIKFEVDKISREREAAQQEAEVYRLRSENLELEMRLKNNELTMLAMNVARKNEMLQSLTTEVSGLTRIDDADRLRRGVAELARSLQQSNHSDGNWQTFEQRFRLLHPEFITTLSALCSALTPTELKICQLLKINLSTKEIADLLNVTGGNIDVHRSRIRRKLKLEPTANLTSYLASL